MSLFQLDPHSIVARARGSGGTTRPPTIGDSLVRGILGLIVVSAAGFSPWPIVDRWFRTVGEVGLYVACTVVFIGLSGICLHRLIIGPGSLSRSYKLFSVAFFAYAVAWVAVWTWLRGDEGIVGGLLAATTLMGAILAFAFDAPRVVLKIIVALFVLNTLGYYAGSWVAGGLAAITGGPECCSGAFAMGSDLGVGSE